MFGRFREQVRGRCVGGVWALMLVGVGSQAVQTQEIVTKETQESKQNHYKLGSQYFNEKKWALAADQLFLSDLQNPEYGTRARLRLAYAQTQLGLKSYAAFHVNALSDAEVKGPEARTLESLKETLATELKVYKTNFYSVTPYFGASLYSKTSSKKSALIYGASGTWASKGWGVSLGAEGVNVKFRSTSSTNYSQTQITLGLSKWLDERWSVRVNGAAINTASTSYKGNIYGIGATVGLWSGGWLGADLNYSRYPTAYNSKALGLNQGSLSFSQELYSDADVRLTSNLAYQTILVKPKASKPTSGVVLDSSYHRFALGADLGVGVMSFGVAAWLGHEAFGVRNQGALVYNALEEHNGGWSVNVGSLATDQLRLFVSYSREKIDVSGVDASSQAIVGGLTGYF